MTFFDTKKGFNITFPSFTMDLLGYQIFTAPVALTPQDVFAQLMAKTLTKNLWFEAGSVDQMGRGRLLADAAYTQYRSAEDNQIGLPFPISTAPGIPKSTEISGIINTLQIKEINTLDFVGNAYIVVKVQSNPETIKLSQISTYGVRPIAQLTVTSRPSVPSLNGSVYVTYPTVYMGLDITQDDYTLHLLTNETDHFNTLPASKGPGNVGYIMFYFPAILANDPNKMTNIIDRIQNINFSITI